MIQTSLIQYNNNTKFLYRYENIKMNIFGNIPKPYQDYYKFNIK